MLGAGRWAKEERGGGRGSDLPVSLLALGKILKQSLFLISLCASFVSELPYFVGSVALGPWPDGHMTTRDSSHCLCLGLLLSSEPSLGSAGLAGRGE